MSTWFFHLKNLLGNSGEVEQPDDGIPNIFENLDINDDIFTIDEYRKVKKSLKAGKATGPGEIPPDFFQVL